MDDFESENCSNVIEQLTIIKTNYKINTYQHEYH